VDELELVANRARGVDDVVLEKSKGGPDSAARPISSRVPFSMSSHPVPAKPDVPPRRPYSVGW